MQQASKIILPIEIDMFLVSFTQYMYLFLTFMQLLAK